MQKRLKIIIVVVIAVILVLVPLFWILTMGFGANIDYWTTYHQFNSITKTSNNKIAFDMPVVSGYPDGDVSFTDCAFSLEVNGTQLPPVNLHLNNNNSMEGPYWQAYAQISKGAGPFKSVTFLQGNISYIVTFIDVNNDGRVYEGDQVTVECTQPLTLGTSYLLNVFVDIDGTWGIGLVYSTFQN
jgi:hypothetical protein